MFHFKSTVINLFEHNNFFHKGKTMKRWTVMGKEWNNTGWKMLLWEKKNHLQNEMHKVFIMKIKINLQYEIQIYIIFWISFYIHTKRGKSLKNYLIMIFYYSLLSIFLHLYSEWFVFIIFLFQLLFIKK